MIAIVWCARLAQQQITLGFSETGIPMRTQRRAFDKEFKYQILVEIDAGTTVTSAPEGNIILRKPSTKSRCGGRVS